MSVNLWCVVPTIKKTQIDYIAIIAISGGSTKIFLALRANFYRGFLTSSPVQLQPLIAFYGRTHAKSISTSYMYSIQTEIVRWLSLEITSIRWFKSEAQTII